MAEVNTREIAFRQVGSAQHHAFEMKIDQIEIREVCAAQVRAEARLPSNPAIPVIAPPRRDEGTLQQRQMFACAAEGPLVLRQLRTVPHLLLPEFVELERE